MGPVHRLATGQAQITLGDAVAAFLATLSHPGTAGTLRAYSGTLHAMLAGLGEDTTLAGLTPAALAAWFAGKWGQAAPATWDSRRGTLKSWARYCEDQGWITGAADLMRGIGHRRVPADRSRALTREQVGALLAREDTGLREKVLWRLLYETAARSAEVLRLDVEDLDMPNRRARVVRKGGAIDVIVWQTGTARLLPRLLKGRKTGPLFLTERRARVALAPADIDAASGKARLSYNQAAAIFTGATGGWTLHQLRHSALTHAAEDGVSAPMLMARSGHTSITSLAKYARVSAEALQRHQEQHDPARRR